MMANMVASLRLLNSRASAKILGAQYASTLASQRLELCPPEIGYTPPSFQLDGQLERVLCCHPETTLAHELKRLRGGKTVHRGSYAYHMRDVLLEQRTLAKGRWVSRFPAGSAAPSVTHAEISEDSAFVSSFCGVRYFGHWLRDDLVTLEAARRLGMPVSLSLPAWPDVPLYQGLLDAAVDTYDSCRFRSLWVFDDVGQNIFRRQRYRDIQEKLAVRIVPEYPDGANVYLRRGMTGLTKRKVINDRELTDDLEASGFVVADMESDATEIILRRLLRARNVITVEGSQHNHAFFLMNPKANFISLVDPRMFTNVAKDVTTALGFSHGIVVGVPEADGFTVPPHEVLQTLELMERSHSCASVTSATGLSRSMPP